MKRYMLVMPLLLAACGTDNTEVAPAAVATTEAVTKTTEATTPPVITATAGILTEEEIKAIVTKVIEDAKVTTADDVKVIAEKAIAEAFADKAATAASTAVSLFYSGGAWMLRETKGLETTISRKADGETTWTVVYYSLLQLGTVDGKTGYCTKTYKTWSNEGVPMSDDHYGADCVKI